MPLITGAQPAGFLTPRVGPGATVGVRPELTPDAQQQLTQRIFNQTYNENRGISWYRGLAETAAASAIDLGDTLLSSLNDLTPTGMAGMGPERGDVWNLTEQYGGTLGKELESYYSRNQGRIELISGVAGAIGTGYMAGELLLPAITNRLANSSAISSSKLWQWGARTNAMTRSNMIAAQQEAAMAGEAYQMWKNPAGRAFRRWETGKGVGKALFEEAAIGATMHTNESVWSDEWSTNLMFMGLGAGIGGGLYNVAARYEMRALANSPEMVKLRADSIDPQGFTSLRENTPASDVLSLLQNVDSKESANLTSLMLEARQATPKTADSKIASRFDTLRAQAEEQAANSLQKISTKGITWSNGTRFNIDTKEAGSAGAHVMQTLHDDPVALFGLDSMGVWPKAVPGDDNSPLFTLLQNRQKQIDTILEIGNRPNSNVSAAEIRQAGILKKQQALTLVDGTWMAAKTPDAYAFSAYRPGDVKLTQRAKDINEFQFATDTGKTVLINESLLPKVGLGKGGPNFESLPINDRLQIIEGMDTLMNRMIRTNTAYVLPDKANWFQLDAAVEFKRRNGQVDLTKSGFNSIDDVRLASLKAKKAAIKDTRLGGYWDRLAWNLPLPSTQERIYDGAGDSMRAVLEAADRGAGLKELEELRNQIVEINGFDVRSSKSALDGNMFTFNRDANGKWKTPVVGFFDNSVVGKPLDRHAIAQANAEIKAERFFHLTHVAPSDTRMAPTLVPRLAKAMIASPDFHPSQQIRGLSDDQVTGLGHPVSQAAGEILTREFRARDNKTTLSLLRMRESVNRVSDEYLHEITKPLADLQKQLSAAANAPSKTLVNQFFSNTSGWDIEKHVDIGGGKFGFALMQTENNAARLGKKVEKGELLRNPRTGAEIVLDELGLSFVLTFNEMASMILRDNNRVRIARGLHPIRKKNFYAPPPDTRDKVVGFTFDEDNQLVPGGAIVTSTQEEFNRLRDAKNKTMPKGYTFRTREQIAETADLFDRAAMDWIDPGVGFAPVKTQKGSLSSDMVNPNAIGDTLNWMKRQVEQLGTNTVRVLYDSQLGIARARGAVERAVGGVKADSPIRSIWDEYEAIALGRNLADTQRSISGQPMRAIESRINMGLAAVWPAMKWMAPSHLTQWVVDAAGRMGAKVPSNVRSFHQLVDSLGPHSPYQNIDDYLEQNFKVNRPPEIRGIAQNLNRMSAALVLRYFELPMAAMNMLGIVTTLPSILRSGRAPISAHYKVGRDRIGIVDGMKILGSSFNDMLHQSRHADWNFMVRNGDTTQQVAEFNKQLSTVTDRGTFKRVFLGDKTIESKNVLDVRSLGDVKDIMRNKGVDGLISVLTDSTENWSRTWAHFAGLRLADLQGITGIEARHSFAREVANSAIANYNPMNRPEFFQSAFGSMFGLFMSYMQAYNQRLFRWMEKSEYDNIGRQLVMQSSLFGLASLPGFNAVQSGLLAAGVGKTDSGEDATLLDHIYAKLGPAVGSAFAHGGLSELGVALYTRGDMNYRDVTLDPTRLMAGFGVVSQAASAVQESIQSMFSSNSVENNGRLAEIVTRNMPNRVLKGIMSQLANGGQDIDSRGQIISENQNFFESALRMMGLRSVRQQGAIEAFYSNRQAQQREAARMDMLRNETRSFIRNNPNWQNELQGVFDQYVQSGGQPAHFRTWIRDQIRASSSPRDVNDLMKALRSPNNQLGVWRYQTYSPD